MVSPPQALITRTVLITARMRSLISFLRRVIGAMLPVLRGSEPPHEIPVLRQLLYTVSPFYGVLLAILERRIAAEPVPDRKGKFTKGKGGRHRIGTRARVEIRILAEVIRQAHTLGDAAEGDPGGGYRLDVRFVEVPIVIPEGTTRWNLGGTGHRDDESRAHREHNPVLDAYISSHV
jgi:hypothetical protein